MKRIKSADRKEIKAVKNTFKIVWWTSKNEIELLLNSTTWILNSKIHFLPHNGDEKIFWNNLQMLTWCSKNELI